MAADKILEATSSVLGLLPKIAGFVGGLTAIGLLLGWREMSSYYSTLGAPWVISMMSPTRFIAQSAGLLCAFGLSIFMSIVFLAQRQITYKGLIYGSVVFLGLSGVLFFFGTYPFDWFEPKTQHLFLNLGAGGMAISAGLTIGEVVARLAKKDLKWEGHELMLIYFFVISFGIYRAPNVLGQSQALLDIETKFSSAPIIELKSLSPDRIWRLVTHIDSNFLAISFPSQGSSHVFKIFGSNEIAEIQSTSAK